MKKYYYKVTNINSCSIYSKGKYNLHYTKGKTVEAVSGSLGIMVFDSMSNVHSFLKYQILTDSKLKESIHQRVLVYKVIGIGKKPTPEYISSYITEDKINEYYINKNNKNLTVLRSQVNLSTKQFTPTLPGTVCFKKVQVIDLVENDIRKHSLKYPIYHIERGLIETSNYLKSK